MSKLKFKAFREIKTGKWLHNHSYDNWGYSGGMSSEPYGVPYLLRNNTSIKERKLVMKTNGLKGLLPKGREGIDYELVDIELIVKPNKKSIK